jgi:hypothetical protein
MQGGDLFLDLQGMVWGMALTRLDAYGPSLCRRLTHDLREVGRYFWIRPSPGVECASLAKRRLSIIKQNVNVFADNVKLPISSFSRLGSLTAEEQPCVVA